MNKTKVAVFFGGKSYEHDVSILTGIQVIQAIDITKYEPIPVYIDLDGNWWTGKTLTNIKNYPLTENSKKDLNNITLNIGSNKYKNIFHINNSKLFTKNYINFDIAFFALHGNLGETGSIQGLMEMGNIPYTGENIISSAIYMDKIKTKSICKLLGIKVLDEVSIKKPSDNKLINITEITKNLHINYPVCLKPANLGSSIGVKKANNKDELNAAILSIFKLDTEIIIEPFIENLKEYNIAIMKNTNGETITSAIEEPINKNEFLTFNDKYLNKKGTKKISTKLALPTTETLLSGRIFNPKIKKEMKEFIENSAIKLFEYMNSTGTPRIDFLCNSKTNELWLNEVNPIPGALGFYLWENSVHKINYTKLIDIIIQNGFKNFTEKNKNIDLNLTKSKIFN